MIKVSIFNKSNDVSTYDIFKKSGGLIDSINPPSVSWNKETAHKNSKQESPANAKGTRDSSACMKAHC